MIHQVYDETFDPSELTELNPSATMLHLSVPTLSQQSHFMWLCAEVGGDISPRPACLPPNPSEEVHKHEESTGRFSYLPDLLSLPFPFSAGVIPGSVWVGVYVCVLM